MDASLAKSLLFYAGALLQVLIVATIFSRRLYLRFPIFTAYTVLVLLRTPLFLYLRGRYPWAHFYAYWAGEMLSWALCLAAIQEVMQQLFDAYKSVSRLIVILFRWGAALLIAFAFLTAYASPGSDPERLMAGILVLERSARIVQVGLLSLVFLLAGFLRLRWPQPAFGIALGLGIFVSIELAAVTMRAHGGGVVHATFAWLNPLAFDVAQVCWIFYFARPEPVVAAPPAPAPIMQGWDTALSELLRR